VEVPEHLEGVGKPEHQGSIGVGMGEAEDVL